MKQQPFVFDYDGDVGSSWVQPSALPNLSGERVIALDTETYDPCLMERGSGWDIGNGHIIGISVAVNPTDAWYLPVRRKACPKGFPLEQLMDWVTATFTKEKTMVGANLIYDAGWLQHHGAVIESSFYDVQFVEALLDEHKQTYSLDSLADHYGFCGKKSNELYDWCSRTFGGLPDGRQRQHMHEAPLNLVGPYAEGDAYLPLQIRDKQRAHVSAQELGRVVDLEHRLIPMLIAMRMRGVRVDMKARDNLAEYIDERLTKAKKIVMSIGGVGFNTNASSDLARVFDANGWEYPLLPPTVKQLAKEKATGIATPIKPSFKKDWLLQQDIPFAKAVADVRRLDKLKGTFVDGYFKLAHEGRIHSSLHPLRTGDYGTVSGRLSSSSPNVQNIPSRDPEFGPLIRGLFLPEEGEEWVSSDYSQIELRMLAHYARGEGATDARRLLNTDLNADFHQMVMDKTGLPRKPAKTVSFSLCYGSGVQNTADLLNCTVEEAVEFRNMHFAGMPFMKATFEACMATASTRGYLFTILGRRARFPHWEPDIFRFPDEHQDDLKELGLFDSRDECDDAVTAYFGKQGITNLRGSQSKRARTYKALNSLLQGSAADLMKQAMVDIWESGVCDTLGAPLITVHDELNWSSPRTTEADEAISEANVLMENAIPITVPVRVETDKGKDWGHLA